MPLSEPYSVEKQNKGAILIDGYMNLMAAFAAFKSLSIVEENRECVERLSSISKLLGVARQETEVIMREMYL